MGSACKYSMQQNDCCEINTETSPNKIEKPMSIQTSITYREQKNQQQEKSPFKFFVIYPKNQENIDQLKIKLQLLKNKFQYRFEEFEVCSSNMDNIESNFSLGNYDGEDSFNIFRK